MLAHVPASAVAREVIDAYAEAGGRTLANPVGTGPYRWVNFTPGQSVVLERAGSHWSGTQEPWQRGVRRWRQALLQQASLADQLVAFVAAKRSGGGAPPARI